MGSGSHLEVVVRRRHVQVSEKHIRQLGIVVLSGMNENLVMRCVAEAPAHDGGFDELRTGADDGHDLETAHRRSGSLTCDSSRADSRARNYRTAPGPLRSSAEGSRTPHSHIQPAIRAGLPTTSA